MLFRIRVGGVSRDDVTNPAERSACAEPETGRQYKPENARDYATVVELTDAGNDERQHGGE